jgi:hypothetical protein
LNAATYRNIRILSNRINEYLGELEAYSGTKWGGDVIEDSDIAGKVLRLIIPKDSMTPIQREAFKAVTSIARSKNLRVIVAEF